MSDSPLFGFNYRFAVGELGCSKFSGTGPGNASFCFGVHAGSIRESGGETLL